MLPSYIFFILSVDYALIELKSQRQSSNKWSVIIVLKSIGKDLERKPVMIYVKGHPIVALAGGVGGAKLALGLYRCLQDQGQAKCLTVIGNTGDDMEYLGLYISPDLDTLMYTLSGLANPVTGWGIAQDTDQTLMMLSRYGYDNWFWLGDRDIATHLLRTNGLNSGRRLTELTAQLSQALGIECQLLPMCDQPVRTLLQTVEAGQLPFQEYFVRRRAADTVTALTFQGAEQSSLSDEVREALTTAALVVICPSNPYLSVGPILAVSGLRELINSCTVPVVVVSPIVGGAAIKGPAAALMRSLGGEASASAWGVARFYTRFATHFVLDQVDADQQTAIEALGLKVLVTDTIMKSDEDKIRLANEILTWQQEDK
jgi:LPPG:FO 2-phospho-L-lactate transferase